MHRRRSHARYTFADGLSHKYRTQRQSHVLSGKGRPRYTLTKHREPGFPFHIARNTPARTTQVHSLSRSTPTNILVTYNSPKAVKPSKIPAGKVVRSPSNRSLPVSRKQRRAEHTRRRVSGESTGPGVDGHWRGMTSTPMCTDDLRCIKQFRRWLLRTGQPRTKRSWNINHMCRVGMGDRDIL